MAVFISENINVYIRIQINIYMQSCFSSKSTSGDALFALSWTCIVLREGLVQNDISEQSLQQLVCSRLRLIKMLDIVVNICTCKHTDFDISNNAGLNEIIVVKLYTC